MSCQIRDNKFYAPNGAESILYKDLESKLGSAQASDLFVLAYTDGFRRQYPQSFSTPKKEGEYKLGKSKINYGDYTNPFTGKSTNQIELKLIETPKKYRGQGQAKRVLNEFLAYTDSLGKDVVLIVSPRDKETSEKGLYKFYKDAGFIMSPSGVEMVRYRKNSAYDKNGEPKANKVIEFAREINEETEPLSFAEQQEVRMMMTEFPFVETSVDLLSYLENAFYKDGLFNPTIKCLTDRLYSKYEAENLLSDVKLLAKAKTAIEKLKRTETIENLVVVESSIKTNEINSFGKFKLANPYIIRQDLIEELGGTENPDLSEVVDKEVTEEFLAEFKRIPVIDEDGNPVLNKVVYENASKVVDSADVFEALTEEELKEKLLDYGIKLDEVDPFTLKNFLENPSVENTLALNRNSPQREKVIKISNQERDLVFLEANKTEEQLFEELNLLQTETENVYHRIEKVNFEEMKQALDLDNNISELQAYKDYFGYKESPTKKENLYRSAIIETDIEYLKDEFVADFNAEILKNPNHEFYNKFEVNEKGISLKYNDPISISQIQAYIQDDVN